VIIQVWITSLLGVISERLLVADENILFIRGTFARRWGSVKGIRAIFSLLASGPAFARQRQAARIQSDRVALDVRLPALAFRHRPANLPLPWHYHCLNSPVIPDKPGKSNRNHERHEIHQRTEIWRNQDVHRVVEQYPPRNPFILRVFSVVRGLNCRRPVFGHPSRPQQRGSQAGWVGVSPLPRHTHTVTSP